jgi:hypothetical protein
MANVDGRFAWEWLPAPILDPLKATARLRTAKSARRTANVRLAGLPSLMGATRAPLDEAVDLCKLGLVKPD